MIVSWPKCGRTVAEVARELDCDWHTVNDTVLAYGQALLDADTDRIGQVTALGLDETLFARFGRWRTQAWAPSIVDVGTCTLLDMVEGRDSAEPISWLDQRGVDWRAQVRYGVLDLSGPYRAVFNQALDHVTQIADPFHWCGWRMTSSTSAAAVSRTRRWVIGDASTIRCIGSGPSFYSVRCGPGRPT
jgi:transposase